MKYFNLTQKIIPSLIFCLAIGIHGDAQVQLARSVISSGGVDISGHGLRLTGTVGQTFIGTTASNIAEVRIGFWEQVRQISTDVQEFPASSGGNEPLITGIYPNPVIDHVRVDINLSHPGLVEVFLLDELGRNVGNVYHGSLPSGRFELAFETTELQAGYYTLWVVAGKTLGSGKLIVVE